MSETTMTGCVERRPRHRDTDVSGRDALRTSEGHRG